MSASVRLSRIRPYLACPKCHGDLFDETDHLRRGKCASRYPLRSGKIYFADSLTSKDSLDSVKGRLKRVFGKLYYLVGVPVLGPSFPFNHRRKIFSFIDPQKAVVVDLGAGNYRVSVDIVTLDGANTSGPVSLLLLIIIEGLSTLLALGSERAEPYTYLLLCLCLFPLKFLDWPFVGRRRMLTLAPTIVSVMRKP